MAQVCVIHNSVTGFSTTYAQWIGDELGATVLPWNEARRMDLSHYDLVIYGAGVRMSVMRGFHEFRRVAQKAGLIESGRVIVWANGGTPQHPDRDWKVPARTFSREELAKGTFPFFYFEGGVRYEGLSRAEYLLLKTFAKRVQKHRDKGEWAVAVADNIENGYDHTRREAIAPLIVCARKMLELD
ncbi:hypothetical protein I6E29_06625 [Arcanobacterium haemolyticum]|nr:hypothetical protein [Arcanobacterium haemolyticum]